MNVYLVRHTSVNSHPDICYGWTDVDVSDNFYKEAERIKELLPDEEFTFYSSDLKRCVKLAEYLSDEVSFDSDLREINFGNWEGKNWSDIEKDFENDLPFDFVNKRTPNGESFKDQSERVLRSWKKLRNSENKNIVIVAHGGTIRIILCELLGIPLENAFRVKIDYGSLTSITIQDAFITANKINY